MEPKVEEYKFYAPGVGIVLAVKTSGGEGREELVRSNTTSGSSYRRRAGAAWRVSLGAAVPAGSSAAALPFGPKISNRSKWQRASSGTPLSSIPFPPPPLRTHAAEHWVEAPAVSGGVPGSPRECPKEYRPGGAGEAVRLRAHNWAPPRADAQARGSGQPESGFGNVDPSACEGQVQGRGLRTVAARYCAGDVAGDHRSDASLARSDQQRGLRRRHRAGPSGHRVGAAGGSAAIQGHREPAPLDAAGRISAADGHTVWRSSSPRRGRSSRDGAPKHEGRVAGSSWKATRGPSGPLTKPV